MIDIDRIKAQIAEIDLTAAAARLAELDEELDRISTARGENEASIRDAEQRLSVRRGGPNPDAAAAAVIEGADVLDRVDTVDAAEERVTALRAARLGLDRRRQDYKSDRRAVTYAMNRKVAAALVPVEEFIAARFGAVLEEFAQLGASVRALEAASDQTLLSASKLRALTSAAHRAGINLPAAAPLPEVSSALVACLPALDAIGRGDRARRIAAPAAAPQPPTDAELEQRRRDHEARGIARRMARASKRRAGRMAVDFNQGLVDVR